MESLEKGKRLYKQKSLRQFYKTKIMEKKINDLNAFEAELRTALKSTGYLFPTTDKEMDYFMEHGEPIELPLKYQSLDFLFNEEVAPIEQITCNEIDLSETSNNWALAARNGKELPQSILEKMKEDKKNSLKNDY